MAGEKNLGHKLLGAYGEIMSSLHHKASPNKYWVRGGNVSTHVNTRDQDSVEY